MFHCLFIIFAGRAHTLMNLIARTCIVLPIVPFLTTSLVQLSLQAQLFTTQLVQLSLLQRKHELAFYDGLAVD